MAFVIPMFAAIGGGSAATGAAIAATVAASAMSAVASIKQGQAAKAAAQYNAQVGEQNATAAEQQAQSQAFLHSRRASMENGGLLANYGASGVVSGEGSPLEVLAQSAANAEWDRQTIVYNGRVRANSLRNQAGLDTAQGETAEQNGYMSAAGSLLQGAGQAYGMSRGPGSTVKAT